MNDSAAPATVYSWHEMSKNVFSTFLSLKQVFVILMSTLREVSNLQIKIFSQKSYHLQLHAENNAGSFLIYLQIESSIQ